MSRPRESSSWWSAPSGIASPLRPRDRAVDGLTGIAPGHHAEHLLRELPKLPRRLLHLARGLQLRAPGLGGEADGLHHLLDGGALLGGGGGDLLAGPRELAGDFHELADRRARLVRQRLGVVRPALAFTRVPHRARDGRLDLRDDRLHLSGGAIRAIRQAPHLLRDDRKAPSLSS